jgi:Ca2+-binding EF-hand superfamily protein
MFDKDGKGFISQEDLAAVLATTGYTFDQKQILSVWRILDISQKGVVRVDDLDFVRKVFNGLGKLDDHRLLQVDNHFESGLQAYVDRVKFIRLAEREDKALYLQVSTSQVCSWVQNLVENFAPPGFSMEKRNTLSNSTA